MTVGSKDCENLTGTIADVVFDQVRQSLPKGLDYDITLDSSLYEVGMDSLTRMDVLNRLEEAFGLRFSEELLYDMETCRDLMECIEEHMTGGNSAERPAALASKSAPAEKPAVVQILPEHYDVTQFPECVALAQRLAGVAALGIDNPFFRVNQRASNASTTIDSCEMVNFASFNYLAMAGNPQVGAAAKRAIDQFGTSASASRLVGGENTLLRELDEEIARFVGTEAAVVLPSGHGTNESVLGHLFGPEDLILYDELAHNSVEQGTVLSHARRRAFPHNNVEFLDKLLGDIRGNHRRVAIVIEGVYSMDGDFPDLPQFIEVKKRHQALLYVDEAHSIGVMGATGRGICEHFGVDPDEGDLWMGTISKALGSGGGYIAGPETLIQYLKYTTPAFVFATGPSPANTGAALAALRLLRKEPERVARLRSRSRLFLKLARDSGLDTGKSTETPIIPIILGNSMQCIRVSSALLQHGIDARPILYPAVPEPTSRIRFLISVDHTDEQICRTVELLAECIAACKGTSGESSSAS